VEALKSMVSGCESIDAEAEVLQDMLETERKNKAEIEKPNSQNTSIAAVLGKSPTEVQAEKLRESERVIDKLTHSVTHAENEVSKTNANIEADLAYFEEQYTTDVKLALGTFAATEREHALRMQAVWKAFIEDIQGMDESALYTAE